MKPLHRVVLQYGVGLPAATVGVLAALAYSQQFPIPGLLFFVSLLMAGFDDTVNTMSHGGAFGIETSAARDHGDTQPTTSRRTKAIAYFGGVFALCWVVMVAAYVA